MMSEKLLAAISKMYRDDKGNDKVVFAFKNRSFHIRGNQSLNLDYPDVVVYPKEGKPFVINIYDSITDFQRNDVYTVMEYQQIKIFRNEVGTVQQLWYDIIKRELKVKCIL